MLLAEWNPTWMRLRAWGSSRAIKSSYLWFFAVPLAARFCEKLPATIEVSILGTPIDLTLRLPFRWTILFWMSACFAAGELLYLLFCPLVVRAYGSFTDFRKLHAGNVVLRAWSVVLPEEQRNLVAADRDLTEREASNLFDRCQAVCSLERPWMARVSALFFLAGAVLLLVLAYDSIRSVLEMSGGPPGSLPLPNESA